MVADLTSVLAPHHAAAVAAAVERFGTDDACVALLLVGSLAHGSGSPGSDVDVILVASEEEFARRRSDGTLAFVVRDLATWAGGYVDVKVTSRTMLEQIARRGSDAARYAFRDARILVTRDPSIESLVEPSRASRSSSARRASTGSWRSCWRGPGSWGRPRATAAST